MSNLLVKCGRAKPSYTGQICVTPSPESTTTPVISPETNKKVCSVYYVCYMYCKFGNFCENFIFANSIKRHIWDVKNLEQGMIYLNQ